MNAAPAKQLRLTAPARYQLRHTLSILQMGRRDPCLQLADHAARLALLTPEGPASVEVVHDGRQLRVSAWGDGAPWTLERTAGLLGLDDDPRPYQPTDRMKTLCRPFSGVHLTRTPQAFPRVVQIILLQLVSWQDGFAAWQRSVRKLGTPAPGPLDLRLPPAPETWRGVPYYELVPCGVIPKLARTIRRAAGESARIEAAAAAGKTVFAQTLKRIPGVGEWTTQLALGTALGDADALLTGDHNLPHTVAWFLAGEQRGDDARLVELLEPHRPHRFRVVRLLWLAGIRAPRHGPRLPSLRSRIAWPRGARAPDR